MHDRCIRFSLLRQHPSQRRLRSRIIRRQPHRFLELASRTGDIALLQRFLTSSQGLLFGRF